MRVCAGAWCQADIDITYYCCAISIEVCSSNTKATNLGPLSNLVHIPRMSLYPPYWNIL